MGLAEFDLSGHWKDELAKLKSGLAALERQRADYRLDPRRVMGRYDLGSVARGTASMFEKNGSNLYVLRVPDGRYAVDVGIQDDTKSHGPMWIEVNGVEYSDTFTVPAGQQVRRTIETSAVDGKIKVLFDNATSADWYASTLTVTRIDPRIAHVPVRRVSPGQELVLRATVTGVAPISRVRVFYGDQRHGFAVADMQRVDPQLYRATIPQSKIVEGLSYFLEAADTAGRLATSNPVAVLVSSDDQPPVLRHTPVLTARPMRPLRIVAEVEDPSGIQWVRLRYRGLSQHQDFQVLPMLPTGRGNEFEATIPGGNIDPKFDLMYLFEVMDNAGNGKIYPDLTKETPYVVVKVDDGKMQ
jgi:hypothetical protein